jgi:hypothetical protein
MKLGSNLTSELIGITVFAGATPIHMNLYCTGGIECSRRNFWAGIWTGNIMGPYFFDGTVTGEAYLEMLCEVVLPELENSPLQDNTEIIWQQDGATLRYSLRVREFLNNSFPEWIGRRGTLDCPSPPIT